MMTATRRTLPMTGVTPRDLPLASMDRASCQRDKNQQPVFRR
jgi:hypothetical protein